MWKYFCGLCALFLLSCTSTSKEKTLSITEQTASRPDSFASDSVMLDYIQKVHFNYMWDGAEQTSGLAPERIHLDRNYPQNDSSVVTTGGSGFGIAGILVAIDRKFISREEGVARLHKIVDYLTRADRFHGVWPHWLDGPTGKVKPFGTKDDGGDLVESCFVMQSLLCVRQYFENGNQEEQQLCTKINKLWHEMEFDWYQNGKDVIYWHWSPYYGWEMNFPLEGYNEALIVYVLAASSPTHPVPASAYHNGWARGGDIKTSATPYGLPLELGLDPRKIKDRYADYWNVVRNHALSDYRYCVENPKKYKGYGENCWGLIILIFDLISPHTIHCFTSFQWQSTDRLTRKSSFIFSGKITFKHLKIFSWERRFVMIVSNMKNRLMEQDCWP